jgi:hypothetical protein
MMKTTVPAIVGACALLVACIAGAAEPIMTFTGIVTDTMCGARPHSNMLKDKTDAECARQCARGQYGFALNDGTAVMKLSDQKTSAKYAGQEVRVTGVYDDKNKTLKVASIEPTHGN